jgi:anaerobic selenocysteine-containing dehydrogenase
MFDEPLMEDGEVLGVCPHDCPDTCSIVSTVETGRLKRVTGNPDHPVTQGHICRKYAAWPRRLYGPDRLTQPLRRFGPKGSGRYEPMGWDEALAEIGDKWQRILADSGPYAILPFFGSGTEGMVHGHIAPKRFFNRLGALQPVRTICTKAGREGYRATMGTSAGADPMRISETGLVIDWGVNTAATNVHQQIFLKQARAAGAKYVVINPVAITGTEQADLFLRPRPGTDAALALAVMHVIVKEGLIDRKFIDNHTLGFKEMSARLADYPPEKAARITGVPEADIVALACLYGETPHSFIYVGPGCQRHSNGGMTVRTIACLPGLTGAWRHPGGGLYFPTSTAFPGDFSALEGDDLRPNAPASYNMIRLADMLRGDGVQSLFVCNGNPASVLYNQNALRHELGREDLFTVVHERLLTDTARFADIVLPATTQFEQNDILFSYYFPSMALNHRAIAPVGEARSNLNLFRQLARVMGFSDAVFGESERDIVEHVLALAQPAIQGIDRSVLEASGWAPTGVDPVHEAFARHQYPTPSGRIEFLSETLAEMGKDPLPAYVPPKESPDGSPDLFERYPLQLITPSGHSIHNASYADKPGFKHDEKTPALYLNPDDARRRLIDDGRMVRVFNDRGSFVIWARVSPSVREGVAAAPGQWWDCHYPRGGCANVTTPDFPADMGGGSAFNSNLVQVEVYAGEERDGG